MTDTKVDVNGKIHNESNSENSVRRLLQTLFHLVVLVHFFVVFCFGFYIYTHVTEKQKEDPWILIAYLYFPAYLTIWNLSFQTLFLALALVHDVLRWLDKHDSKLGKKIKYFRDIIFNGLVFPFTCFVTGMFWCVYLIDRELVFPEVYDQIVPWWLNHCVHTNIFIMISIETLLTRRRQPTDVKVERFLWVFVSVLYAVVYYSIYFFGGCWLYGVFGVMTWWQVCIYQTGIWVSTWIFYNMNFIINRLIHREEDIEPKSTKTNGDLESRETAFQTKNYGESERKTKVEFNVNKNETENKDGNDKENGKEWKSIGANVSGVNDNAQEKPFDKSWSTEYRTKREPEKSSL